MKLCRLGLEKCPMSGKPAKPAERFQPMKTYPGFPQEGGGQDELYFL